MKTEEELNRDILKITLVIQENYPELSKYIAEMPVTNPDVSHPEINLKNLDEYYQSLFELVKKYSVNEKLVENN